MAVLEKIRVKFGVVITVVIALALLSFIIDPNTLQSVSSSMSSKYDVGVIDGKSISYQDFQKDVDYYTSLNEILTGTSAQNEQQQISIRNSAWQALLDRYMFRKNAKAAGIFVGEDEMIDLTTGDMVSPIISGDPTFQDESGNFSKEKLMELLQAMHTDQSGSIKMYWDFLQNTILTQQYYAKYGSLFSQSNVTNPLMLAKKVEENNNTTSVEFVMVPYGYEIDSTIVVSDAEIKEYYNSHKKFYKQQASRDIEYVVYEVLPSQEDVAATNEQVASVYDEFSSTDNMKSFLLKNSNRQFSEDYYKKGELSAIAPEINDFVFGDSGKAVSEVINKDNTFYVVRIMDTEMLPDSVFVKHILLQGDDVAKADSLVNVLNSGKESFSNIAAMYSADQNMNVSERGDLGWLTQNYMYPGMESVMSAPLNKVFILDTQYGKHIVKVTERTKLMEKKQVAILEKAIVASKETYNSYYSKANTLATMAAGKYDSFKSAIDSLGLYAHPVNRMLESSDRLGSIDNTKEVTRWVYDAKPGKVSNIITVNNNYFFVVALKGIHKEGYAKVEEVAPSIKSILYAEKLGEKKSAEIAEKIKGMDSMEKIAEALSTTVSMKDNIAFSSLTAQGLDPKFIGALSVSEEGKISGPVAGTIGVYVYRVIGHDTGAFFTEEDAKTRDLQMTQYSMQMLMPVMMEEAKVVDNRARFY